MIPKNLFLIWIGDNKPNYVDFCVNSYKKINPNFNVCLIHIENMYSRNNPDVVDTWKLINTKNTLYYKFYNRYFSVTNLSKTEVAKRVRFSDCFRLFIINKYGGIYVDCDTYPIKPLDCLLSKMFISRTHHSDESNLIYPDIYFFGCEIGYGHELMNIVLKSNINSNMLKYIDMYNIDLKKDCKYYDQYKKFYNCENPNIEDCNDYFVHYRKMSWKNDI